MLDRDAPPLSDADQSAVDLSAAAQCYGAYLKNTILPTLAMRVCAFFPENAN